MYYDYFHWRVSCTVVVLTSCVFVMCVYVCVCVCFVSVYVCVRETEYL